MAITPANYWPLGSTVQKTFTDLSSGTLYRNCGIISVNPVNGHSVIIYRRGISFSGDCGVICIWHSNDGGANWGDNEGAENEKVLFEEQDKDIRNVAGGYDSKGRLFVFYARYNPALVTYLSMNYRYSDDDGTTWTGEFTLATQPPKTDTNTVFSPYGHIVDAGDNILYQTWYGHDDSNIYKLYLYKSYCGGVHFLEYDIKTIYAGDEVLSQPSMVNLGGGCFLVLAKKNNINAFRQFKNEDNITGNWDDYNMGVTNFEDETANNPAPPWLSFINYQGVGIVACYYTKRNTTPHSLQVIFGLAKDLLEPNGNSNWNVNTKKEIYTTPDPPGDITLGYQSFFHPLNQYKSIGNTFEGVTVYNPKIVFIDLIENGMINVFTTLGL